MSVKSASEKTTPLSGSSASKNEEEFDENLGLAKVISAYLKEAKSKSKSPKTTSKSVLFSFSNYVFLFYM